MKLGSWIYFIAIRLMPIINSGPLNDYFVWSAHVGSLGQMIKHNKKSTQQFIPHLEISLR